MRFFIAILFLISPLLAHSEYLNCINARRLISLAYQNHYSKPDVTPESLEKAVEIYLNTEDSMKILLTDNEYKSLMKDVKKNKKRYSSQFLNEFSFATYTNSYFFNEKAYNQTGCEFLEKPYEAIFKAYELYKTRFNIIQKIDESIIKKEFKMNQNDDFKTYDKRAKTKKELISRIDKFIKIRIANDSRSLIKFYLDRRLNKMEMHKYSTIINGFLTQFDNHSNYMEPSDYNFEESLDPEKKGYGVMFNKKPDSQEYPLVIKILKKSVLEKVNKVSGGDLIISVNGIDLKKLSINEISEMLQNGDSASFVFRKFKDKEKNPDVYEDISVKVDKGTYDIEMINSKIITKDNKNFLYVKLDSFYYSQKNGQGSASDLRNIYMDTIEKSNIKLDGVILDLRNNLGGYVDEANRLAHLFIGSNLTIRVVGQGMEEFPSYSEPLSNSSYYMPLIKEPLIVLMNRRSASASEILAGTIQDYNRGLIIGDDHSYGKGSMQVIIPVFNTLNLGEVKVTTNLYYLASGKTPQHSGILSDIVIPSPTQYDKVGEKFEKYSLNPKKSLDNKVDVTFQAFDTTLLNVLKKHSKDRIKKNHDFKKFNKEDKANKYNLENDYKLNPEDLVLNESVEIFNEFSNLSQEKEKNLKEENLLTIEPREYDHSGQ